MSEARTKAKRTVVAWAIVASVLAAGLPGLFLRLKGGGFEDATHPAWIVLHELEQRFGSGAADLVIVVDAGDAPGGIDDIEVTTTLVTMVAELEKDAGVRSVLSPLDGVELLRSQDGKLAALVVMMKGGDEDKMPRVAEFTERMRAICAELCTVQMAGIQATNVAVSTVIFEDLVRAEMLALPITLIALLFVFRGFFAALLPVIVAALSTLCSLGLLSVLSRTMTVSIFAANITTLLAMGLAIDSSLFLVTRYREERARNDVDTAVHTTRNTTGRAVLFSGVVVVASLAGLFAFPQALVTSIGLGGLLTAGVTTAIAMTLTPALLVLFDARLGTAQQYNPEDDIATSWLYRVARGVMRRPALTAIGTVAGLIALAMPFQHFEGTIPDYTMLPPGNATREACATLDGRFLPQIMTPHDVVIDLGAPVFADDGHSEARLRYLADVSAALAKRDDINVVLSPLTLARGVSPHTVIARLLEPRFRESPDIARALDAFVDGDLYRFTLYPTVSVTNPQAMRAVGQLKADVLAVPVPSGVVLDDVRIGGVPAVVQALKDRVQERVPWMLLVVVIVMGGVLGVAFRSVVVPIKAIVLNALSLTASYGAIVVVFQDGLGASLLSFTPTGTSELMLPVLLFSLCFGLSMDYEVILLARVREEVQRGHDDGEAVARALALTGKSIGSAALLFSLVVLAFATSRILSMKALGVGLALAVLIDATVVRGLLAPAAMVLLGRSNWWPSDPRHQR